MRPPILTREDLPLKPRIFQVFVPVADMERADYFYNKVLGLERRGKYQPQPNVEERFYGFDSDRSETMICLVKFGEALPASANAAPPMQAVRFNLTVQDVRGVVAQVAAAGGRIVSDTVTRQSGPFTQDMAFIADPDGTAIELTCFR